MIKTPKYDNDNVTLGYLNKRLSNSEETITKTNQENITKLPKSYSSPPITPYYKDSILCYNNKIYRCINSREQGLFNWNDWVIAATDDTAFNNFVGDTYQTDILELQNQIDGKIETYYQPNDPSLNWITDLDKSKHIGDYWYNTTNNTQWRYNRITDTPITYKWGEVNVPNTVFDLIDKKKSIYTVKPTSYKKDDLWIIEETLSDEDLPIGTENNPIVKGDWVFSNEDSETYNKNHWIKKDEDVKISYLEQNYYTIGDTTEKIEELERYTDSEITKAKNEINLNVSQNYTTKETYTTTVNNFNEQIGTINQTIETQNESISSLTVSTGNITSRVSAVETKTTTNETNINDLKNTINYLTLELLKNYLVLTVDSENKPIATGVNNTAYSCKFKGTPISASISILGTNVGLTASISGNNVVISYDAAVPIPNSTNEYVIKATYQNDGLTYTSEKSIIVNTVPKGDKGDPGEQGIQGIPGEDAAVKGYEPPLDMEKIWLDLNENKFKQCIEVSDGVYEWQVINDYSGIISETSKTVSALQQTTRGLSIDVASHTTTLATIDGELITINGKLEDMAFNFGTKGLSIGTSADTNNSLLDNTGIKVYNLDKLTAIFNNRGSGVDKLIVTGTAQIGYLKFIKSTKNNKPVTKIFHLKNLIEDLTDLEV